MRNLIIGIVCLAAGLAVYFTGYDASPGEQTAPRITPAAQHENPVAPSPANAARSAAENQFAGKPIKDLRVGERIIAHNPEVTDSERALFSPEPDPESWVKLSLGMVKDDGGELHIELLRPALWALANGATPGGKIFLDLEEMGAVGPAAVFAVDPCPPIAPANAELDARHRVVTGTFAHTVGNVIDLKVNSDPAPIGTTANHPFWSESRAGFIPAGELEVGEHLRLAAGDLTTVESITSRGPPEPVYNLEVHGEHVYFVGRGGVLVHNTYLYGNGRKRGVPHRDLKSGDIDQYRYFAKRPGDGLEGHEIWQSANTDAHGLGGRIGRLGRRNPSIALSEADHGIVNRLQEQMIPNPRAMDPIDNIHANLRVLREAQARGVNITNRQINDAGRQAVRFYRAMEAGGFLR